ncbi:MAG TPA: sulfatase/phosphatase domain-containing protein, partial [Bacteroidales bacterium]|nr:sulfatase/phosphatase domain-containing protein [Bacteroidales bacterium]
PTFATLAQTDAPVNIDGMSFKQALLNNETLGQQRTLYWEFHGQSGKQAVRMGKWKAVRLNVHEKGFHDDIELYNLKTDPGETENIASEHKDIVEEMKHIMANEHLYSDNFPFDFELEDQSLK